MDYVIDNVPHSHSMWSIELFTSYHNYFFILYLNSQQIKCAETRKNS
jgi:hypothetical protein